MESKEIINLLESHFRDLGWDEEKIWKGLLKVSIVMLLLQNVASDKDLPEIFRALANVLEVVKEKK